MASPKFFSLLVLISLLSVYASCSSFEDHGIDVESHQESQKSLVPATNAEKVNLSLYYETLCPYCSSFIVDKLKNVFKGDLISIVNLRLVPYGNARIQGPNNIVCQHGPDECYLNSIEACAINHWPDVKQHFKFIYCVENQTIEAKQSKEDAWKSCCRKLRMNPKPIQECYASGLDRKLILQYANETDSLVPPHIYVPWVVVNDHPLQEDIENFISYVCEAYKGPKPEGCKSIPRKINLSENANQPD